MIGYLATDAALLAFLAKTALLCIIMEQQGLIL
jgi:hypothetical protein